MGGSKGCSKVISKPPRTNLMLACCQFSHEVLNGLASRMGNLTISYALQSPTLAPALVVHVQGGNFVLC